MTPNVVAPKSLEGSPSVAVIVLNWNGRDDTLECLTTLVCQTYAHQEIIVVDNGSSDGSVDAIRNAFPQVTLIETGKNLGYAGGNNVGIRYAVTKRFTYFLILNNDTLCPPAFVEELVHSAETHSDAAFVGPVIYFAHEPAKIWSAGAHWNSITQRLELTAVAPSPLRGSKEVEVDSLVGCALLGRTALVERIGMFDERFFLMHEESDLCFRAKGAGYRCYIAVDAGISHKVSVSFGGAGSPLMCYFDERNSLLWASRHLGARMFIAVLIRRVGELVKVISGELRPLQRARPRQLYWQILEMGRAIQLSTREPRYRARLAGLRDYILRRFGDCPPAIRKLNRCT